MRKVWWLSAVLCMWLSSPNMARADGLGDGGGGGSSADPDDPVVNTLALIFSSTVYGGPTYLLAVVSSTTTLAASGALTQEMIVAYLTENEGAVHAAMHLGGGEAATELAQLMGVTPEEQALFARALRAERATLRALLPAGGPSAEQAAAFVAHLRAALSATRDVATR